MRDLRLVSQVEFTAFVVAYSPALTVQASSNGTVSYVDNSTGDAWPDSLVASYLSPMPPKRLRATGWRIPSSNIDPDNAGAGTGA